MGSEESNARWDQMLALREDLDRGSVVMPTCVSRIDGKPHPLSPKAARFAEALAFSDAWSRISEARRGRLAA
ncbi:MAG TPA: hypothetical protein VHJ54_06190 [Solirubrobacterales bacterium]|nr:hypothetical protein [Solirubrobacterales bacterium]